MTGDDRWYEAAFVVGITNALNVVADGLGGAPMRQVEPETAPAEVRTIFADIGAFYGTGGPAADVLGGEIPMPFGLIAHDPGYLADVWAAVRRAFSERRLTRRHKEALAFAVSLTTRSAFGTAFHLAELRRLGVGEDRKSTRLNSSHGYISYAVFCLKKKNNKKHIQHVTNGTTATADRRNMLASYKYIKIGTARSARADRVQLKEKCVVDV